MLRHPNRTKQSGVYHTSTPDYVDLSGSVATGMVSFSAAAATGEWADGDTLGVLIKKDDSNYRVSIVEWDSVTPSIHVVSTELAVGTLVDNDAVTVSAVLTTASLRTAAATPEVGVFTTQSGTSYTVSPGDAGKMLRFTSGSTVTITLDADLPTNFHCLLLRAGAGSLSCTPDTGTTLNGSSSSLTLGARWSSAYVCKVSSTEFEVYY